mgnify:CR=1 FL=1
MCHRPPRTIEELARQERLAIGRVRKGDEPPAISAKVTVHGRVKSIAADTPDEFIHKFSKVLAKEGIDVWAILTKQRNPPLLRIHSNRGIHP